MWRQYFEDLEDNLQSISLISTFVTVICAIQIGYSQNEGTGLAQAAAVVVNAAVLVLGVYCIYQAFRDRFDGAVEQGGPKTAQEAAIAIQVEPAPEESAAAAPAASK